MSFRNVCPKQGLRRLKSLAAHLYPSIPCGTKLLPVLIFAIFSSDPQKKVPTKYVFLLHVLDKNESFQYWVLGTF